MNNPQIYSDGVVNSIQDSPLRVQNKILGALKNMGGAASTVSNDAGYAVNNTGQQVLAANVARKFLSIQNVGTSKVFIRFGSAVDLDTSLGRFSYILAPSSATNAGDGGVLTFDGYVGTVYVKCASGETSTVIATDFI
jgi:hypothetical protein